MFLFAIYFHSNMKLGPDKFFVSWLQKTCVCDNITWEIKGNYAWKIRL